MADINKKLLTTADDTPAPQQKKKGENKFEFVEGSHGAQHHKLVDNAGNPFDVKSEINSIKRTQQDILSKLEGTINTQVTGSNVEETVFERFVFDGTSDRDYYIRVPNNAKGLAAQIRIFGATGDYTDGGLRVKLHHNSGYAVLGSYISELETTESLGSLVFICYPGVDANAYESLDTSTGKSKLSVLPFPLLRSVLFRLYMDGNPDTEKDEGYDIELIVRWIS